MDSESLLKTNSRRFKKVVIWGLRKHFHTHRYIFQGYYDTLKKTGVRVVWVEDEARSASVVRDGDLVLSAETQGRMIPEKSRLGDYHLPIRKDVYYCLHNYKEVFAGNIEPCRLLRLQVYGKSAESTPKLYEGVHFDTAARILYQPWGTNLLPREFDQPVFSRLPLVAFVGSVWNNSAGQGNIEEIGKLKAVLGERRLKFLNLRFVPDWMNRLAVRMSRLAPAIAGRYQVEIDYLPCRMFKNISYGQLGFSNVRKFEDIFPGCNIYHADIAAIIDRTLSLGRKDYLALVVRQQEICSRYTYLDHLNNIMNCIR